MCILGEPGLDLSYNDYKAHHFTSTFSQQGRMLWEYSLPHSMLESLLSHAEAKKVEDPKSRRTPQSRFLHGNFSHFFKIEKYAFFWVKMRDHHYHEKITL